VATPSARTLDELAAALVARAGRGKAMADLAAAAAAGGAPELAAAWRALLKHANLPPLLAAASRAGGREPMRALAGWDADALEASHEAVRMPEEAAAAGAAEPALRPALDVVTEWAAARCGTRLASDAAVAVHALLGRPLAPPGAYAQEIAPLLAPAARQLTETAAAEQRSGASGFTRRPPRAAPCRRWPGPWISLSLSLSLLPLSLSL